MSIINNIIGKASLGAASAGASFIKDKWFKDDQDKIAELMAKQQFGDTWNKMSGEARRNQIENMKKRVPKGARFEEPETPTSFISKKGEKTLEVPRKYYEGMYIGGQVRADNPASMNAKIKEKTGMEWDSQEFREILRLEQQMKEKPELAYTNQRQIDKLQQKAFFKSVKNTGLATANQMVRGTVSTGAKSLIEANDQVAGYLRKTMSDLLNVPEPDIDRTTGYHKMKQGVVDWSNKQQKTLDYWSKKLDEGSSSKLGKIAGSGISSLLLAYGLGAVSGGSRASAAFLAVAESESTYRESRQAGKNPLQSLLTSGISAVGTYKLEKMGFDNLLKNQPGFLVPLVQKTLFEGGQELTQQAWQNTVSKIGYDKARNIWEGAFESFVGGMFGGATGSVMVSTFENTSKGKDIIDQIRKNSGVNKEEARIIFRDIGNAVNRSYGNFLKGLQAAGKELNKEGPSLSMFGAGESRRLFSAGRAFGNEFFGEKRVVNMDTDEDRSDLIVSKFEKRGVEIGKKLKGMDAEVVDFYTKGGGWDSKYYVPVRLFANTKGKETIVNYAAAFDEVPTIEMVEEKIKQEYLKLGGVVLLDAPEKNDEDIARWKRDGIEDGNVAKTISSEQSISIWIRQAYDDMQSGATTEYYSEENIRKRLKKNLSGYEDSEVLQVAEKMGDKYKKLVTEEHGGEEELKIVPWGNRFYLESGGLKVLAEGDAFKYGDVVRPKDESGIPGDIMTIKWVSPDKKKIRTRELGNLSFDIRNFEKVEKQMDIEGGEVDQKEIEKDKEQATMRETLKRLQAEKSKAIQGGGVMEDGQSAMFGDETLPEGGQKSIFDMKPEGETAMAKRETNQEKYDRIQKQIDELEDRKLAEGMSLDELYDDKEVNRLYDERNAALDSDIDFMREALEKKMNQLNLSDRVKKTIRHETLLKDVPQYFPTVIKDSIQEFFDDEEGVVRRIIRSLLEDRGFDEGVFGPNSGFTKIGQDNLKKELFDEAKKTYEGVKDTIVSFQSQSIDEKSNIRNIYGDETGTEKDGGTESIPRSEPREVREVDRSAESGGGTTERAGGELLGESGHGFVTLTPKKQADINKQAREILAEKTDDEITEEDKKILRQYSGAGGLEKAGESGRGLLDEYYTPDIVIDKMWGLAKKWGAVGGHILEPSVGVGKFIANKPKWAKKITGVEIDKTSSRIAKILYPEAEILNQPFEKVFFDDTTKKARSSDLIQKYRVVIGNPPYGQHRGKYAFMDEPKIKRYEEYFIKRGVDLLTDGGILVYIVPSGFLRNGTSKAKDEILKSAKLLEAYRLPSGTFGTTDIGTDIIVLQKQESGAWGLDPNVGKTTYGGERKESRIDLPGERTEELSNDVYFEKHPDNVLGEKTTQNRYGKPMEVIKGDMSELEKIDMTRSLIPSLNEKKLEYSLKYAKSNEDFVDRLKKDYPIEFPVRYKETTVNTYGEILREMKKDNGKAGVLLSADEVEFEKKENARIKKAQKTKGRAELVIESGNASAVMARNKKYAKDITELEENIWDARDFDGSILDDSIPREYLNFMDGRWYSDWDYYSGNLAEKIEQAELDIADSGEERAAKLRKQIEKLKSKMPEKKTVAEIFLTPLAPLSREKINGGEETLVKLFKEWIEDLPRSAFGKSAKWEVRDYVTRIRVSGRSKEENAAIRERRRVVGDRLFQRFYQLNLDEDVKEWLEKEYNKRFNASIEPDYSQMPFRAEGLSETFRGKELTLRQHQVEAVSFIKHKGRGILAHDVGFGKTMEGIVGLHELIQKGWAKKPLLVVPNTMYDKWIEEIQELYPNTKIVGLDNLGVNVKLSDDFEIKDGELAIIKYSALENITFGAKEEERLTRDLRDAMADLSGKKKTKRQAELEDANFDKMYGKSTVKGMYNFEDFGFDAVLVDELHNFKNIFAGARSDKTKKEANEFAVVTGSSSARGVKMYLIAQHILRNNNNRNFIGLTATPFSNSPIEIYNILSLVARDELKDAGLMNVNEFVATFMEMKNTFIVKAGNNVVPGMVVENFKNLSSLQKLVQRYIDFKSAVDSPEMVQARPTKQVINHTLFPNQEQIRLLKDAEELAAKGGKNGELLTAINEMRKVTLSPYLFGDLDTIVLPSATEFVENSPKIYAAMQMIKEVKKTGKGTGQIIYMPLGKKTLDLLKEYLVKQVGYKASEVGIIAGGVDQDKKLKIQKDFNEGKVKVVIGTNTIMEGVDLQGNTTDMYILSMPWKPTELQQLHGRLWRQGNRWANVRIHNLLLEDTVDSFMSQKLEEKTKRLQNIWSYTGSDTLPNDEIDFEAEKMNLIRDPIKRVALEGDVAKRGLEVEVESLEAEMATASKVMTRYTSAQDKLKTIEERIDTAKKYNWYSDIAKHEKTRESILKELKSIEERKDFEDMIEKAKELEKNIAEKKQALTAVKEKYSAKLEEAKLISVPEWESRENDYGAITKEIQKKNEGFFDPHPEYVKKLNNAKKKVETKEEVEEALQKERKPVGVPPIKKGEQGGMFGNNEPAIVKKKQQEEVLRVGKEKGFSAVGHGQGGGSNADKYYVRVRDVDGNIYNDFEWYESSEAAQKRVKELEEFVVGGVEEKRVKEEREKREEFFQEQRSDREVQEQDFEDLPFTEGGNLEEEMETYNEAQKKKESVPKEKRDVRLQTPPQKSAEGKIKEFLEKLDIARNALFDDEFYAKYEMDGFNPLSIERQGNRLMLTHWSELNGDLFIDAEMVYEVDNGKLKLLETATYNPFNGGELRGKDRSFAEMFSENLLDQGWDGAVIAKMKTAVLSPEEKHELFQEAILDKEMIPVFEVKTGMNYKDTKKLYEEKTKKNDAPETMEEIFVAFDEATKDVKNLLTRLSGVDVVRAVPEKVLQSISKEYYRIDQELKEIRWQINQAKTKRDTKNLEELHGPEIKRLEQEKRNLTSKTKLKQLEEFKKDLDELSAVRRELAEIKAELQNTVGTRKDFEALGGAGAHIGRSDADWWRTALQDKEGAQEVIDDIEKISEEIEKLDISFFANYERQVTDYIRENKAAIREAAKQGDGTLEEAAGDIGPEQEADTGDDGGLTVTDMSDFMTNLNDAAKAGKTEVKVRDMMSPPSQKEQVADSLKKGEKSIKEVAQETGILEPNVRRILGVGAKEGKFERVDKGVYRIKIQGQDIAVIQAGNSVEVLPKLAESGFKADMVFLDIPYKTPAVQGGNRGVNYSLISVEEFETVMDAVGKIVKTEDTPVYYMYSQARSGLKKMLEYNNVLSDKGFQVVESGEFQKLYKNGQPVKNMRGEVMEPEGILLLTKSGKFTETELSRNLNFELVRPRGYQTEKPAELLNSIIRQSTNKGDTIFDPFLGSGVSMAEAVREGRKAVGVEISEEAIEKHIVPKVEEAAREMQGIEYEGGDISHVIGEVKTGLNEQAEKSVRSMQEKAKQRIEEKVVEMEEKMPPESDDPYNERDDMSPSPENKDMRRRDINFIHDIVGQAHDIYMTDSKEFAPAKDFEKAADHRRMEKDALDEDFAKVLKKYYDLSKEEKKNVNEVLVMGDHEGKIYAKTYLEELGLTEKEIIGYYAVRNSFDKAQKILIKKMLEAGVKEEQIEDFKSRMKGYVPHRWNHRFVVKTRVRRRIEDFETGEIIDRFYTDSMEDFRTEKEAKAKYDELVKNADEDHEYVLDTLDSLDVDFFQDQELSREKVLGLLENVQSPEEVKSFMEEQIKNMFKEKGFGQHYIRRSNIKGFDTEKMELHIARYFSGFSGFVSKMNAAPKYFEALNSIDARRQKKFHKYMRDLIAYDMGNSRDFNYLKQAGFLYFLANDISFLLVNTTQNYIMGTAELSKALQGAGKIIRPEKEILQAQVNWATQSGMSEEEKQTIGEMLHAGRLGGEMTSELMGFHNNPLYRGVTSVYKKALFTSTAFVEQNVNRVPMFLAARRVLESSERFSDLKELREQVKHGRNKKVREEAQEVLDSRLKDLNYEAFQIEENVHFRYGKQHRSRFQRGIGGVSFLFMHYIRSFLWAMARDLKGREFASFGRKMIYTFILGGALALPFAKMFYGAFVEIMEAMGWWDDDEEEEQEKTFWRTGI
jgi:hypothetical protein